MALGVRRLVLHSRSLDDGALGLLLSSSSPSPPVKTGALRSLWLDPALPEAVAGALGGLLSELGLTQRKEAGRDPGQVFWERVPAGAQVEGGFSLLVSTCTARHWGTPVKHRLSWDGSPRAVRRLRWVLSRALADRPVNLWDCGAPPQQRWSIPSGEGMRVAPVRDALLGEVLAWSPGASSRLLDVQAAVLEELLSNLGQHAPGGGAELGLWVVGEEIRVVLADASGAFGLARVDQVLPALFRKGGHRVQEEGPGAGLGLVMIYDQVSLLELAVAPGRSTAVAVEFPRRGSVAGLRAQGRSLNVYRSEDV